MEHVYEIVLPLVAGPPLLESFKTFTDSESIYERRHKENEQTHNQHNTISGGVQDSPRPPLQMRNFDEVERACLDDSTIDGDGTDGCSSCVQSACMIMYLVVFLSYGFRPPHT